MGRLRGQLDIELPKGYVKQWYIGSTNPDVPTHFILEYVEKGILKMIKWFMRDACWDGCEEYYNRLKALYKDNPSFYSRYLDGEWTSADRMVYPMFNYKKHVINSEDIDINYKDFKKNFIAVDYGSDHPTAILLISKSWANEYIISKEVFLRNTAPSDIVIEIGKLMDFLTEEGTSCSCVYVDPSAKALKDELTKQGINCVINAINNHNDGIGCIRNLLAMGKLFIISTCDKLIGEIYSYRFKDNNNGKDEVVKLGDDFCDSMRYGVYTDYIIGG